MNDYVVLFSGTKVAAKWGAPTVVDMAQALSRIPRFSGNAWEWFPVALHCFVVADLLPVPLKVYGLTHDGAECVGNDVPKPIKTQETSEMEDAIQDRFWLSVGLPSLNEESRRILKAADNIALLGEIHTIGPKGLAVDYPDRSQRAEQMVLYYLRKYPAGLCVQRGGPVMQEFLRRFQFYMLGRARLEAQAIAARFRKQSPFKIIG